MRVSRIFATERRSLVVIAILGLAARLLITPFPGHKYDVRAFLSWSEYLARHPLNEFYAFPHSTPPDHLPGDLLIFAAIGRLALAIWPGFGFSSWYADLFMRLVPMLSDIGLGMLAYVFVRNRVSPRIALASAALVIFNPGLFTASAIWGQWDSFAALLLMGVFLLAVRGHTVALWPLLMYVVLIKPQYIVFGILILLYLIRVSTTRSGPAGVPKAWSLSKSAKDIAAGGVLSLLVFMGVCLPFGVGFPFQPGTRWSILDRVIFAVDRYNDITLGAQNVWSLFGKQIGDPDSATLVARLSYLDAGRILLVVFVALAMLVTLRLSSAEWALLCGGFLAAMSIYSFPTRVHERYMMPAIVFLLFMWPLARRLLPIAIGLSLSYALSLIMAMWWDSFLHTRYTDGLVASLNLALFGWAIAEVLRADGVGWRFTRNTHTLVET